MLTIIIYLVKINHNFVVFKNLFNISFVFLTITTIDAYNNKIVKTIVKNVLCSVQQKQQLQGIQQTKILKYTKPKNLAQH